MNIRRFEVLRCAIVVALLIGCGSFVAWDYGIVAVAEAWTAGEFDRALREALIGATAVVVALGSSWLGIYLAAEDIRKESNASTGGEGERTRIVR